MRTTAEINIPFTILVIKIDTFAVVTDYLRLEGPMYCPKDLTGLLLCG